MMIDRDVLAEVLWDAGEAGSEREPYPWGYLKERAVAAEGDYGEILEIHLRMADAVIEYLSDHGEWEYSSVAPLDLRCPETEGGGVQCRHFNTTDHQHEVLRDGPMGGSSAIARRRKRGAWEKMP